MGEYLLRTHLKMKLLLVLQLCLIGKAVSNEQASVEEKHVWNAIGAFGHSLGQKLATARPRDNMLFSPLSVATAMSMALSGARGATKQEMLNAMGFQGFNDETVRRSFSTILSRKHENTTQGSTDPLTADSFVLHTANRLYASNQFQITDSFKQGLEMFFLARSLSVDFVNNGTQIQKDINGFVEEKTNGLIKDVLKEPLSTNTIVALLNTLYFKGNWVKRMTEHQTPTIFNEGCGDLQVEHNKRLTTTSRFRYVDSAVLHAQMIMLPYVSDDFQAEMLILLPKKEHNCKTQNWFSQVSWDTIKSEMKKMTYESIALEMPAFELNGRYNLEEVLPTLGMPLAFTSGKADFSGISNHRLSIDKVIHQAKMIVTRFGTEAAAATVVAINRLAAYPSIEPIPMKVNKSFFLSIVYHSKQNDEALLPLFTGLVNKV